MISLRMLLDCRRYITQQVISCKLLNVRRAMLTINFGVIVINDALHDYNNLFQKPKRIEG